MHILQFFTYIGDDRTLGYLPVAVLPLAAQFVDANAYAVEVEVGELSIRLAAKVDAPIDTESEKVHQLRIVRVVYPVGIGSHMHYGVDDSRSERASELSHVGWIDMAVQNAWHIVATVNGNELSAQGIAVAVLEKNLFADVWRLGSEVHRHVFAIER